MPLLVHADASPRSRGLTLWSVAVWLMLLFAAFGCLQYVNHASAVWAQLQVLPAGHEGISALHGMLAWDAAYLLAAFAVIVVSAGAILRQAWARPALRWVAILLALWAAVTGWLLFSAMLATQPPGTSMAQLLPRLPYSFQLALLLKMASVLLLAWLAWRLGLPAVRAQFRPRRRR